MAKFKSFKEFCNESENELEDKIEGELEGELEDKVGTYVSIKVKNSSELYDWFSAQDIDVVPEDELHCTISSSRKEFDHTANEEEVIITPEQLIGIEPLGDEGAIVLKFENSEIKKRFNQCMDEGATYDYDTYVPHISITYNGKDLDLSKIKLPDFDIILHNETVEPLDLNWEDKVTDKITDKVNEE